MARVIWVDCVRASGIIVIAHYKVLSALDKTLASEKVERPEFIYGDHYD